MEPILFMLGAVHFLSSAGSKSSPYIIVLQYRVSEQIERNECDLEQPTY